MNRKIFKLLMLGLLLITTSFLTSCTTTNQDDSLQTPTNIMINGTILTFDQVAGADNYRIELTNKQTSAVLRRFVSSNIDLNTLNIPEGDYMIKVQATKNNASVTSEYSNGIEYHQKDINAIKVLKEEALINGEHIKWMGRTYYDEVKKTNTMYYSASGFEVKVKKTEDALSCKAIIEGTNTQNSSKRPYIVLVLDNNFENTITLSLTKATTEVELIGENGFIIHDDEVHTIALYKRSESIDSHIALKELNTTGKFISGVTYKERKIEVIAASSSTGYGNLGTSSQTKTTSNSDALNGFAFLTAQNLNSEINIVSASGWGVYASRWTSPNTLNMRDKYQYVDVFSNNLWDKKQYTPDVIVVNFGTNDLSYINTFTGVEKEKQMQAFIDNYVGFLNDLHHDYPNAQIIIIYGLMLETGIYEATETIYETAKKTNETLAILKVAGDAKGCASHPSSNSHYQISESLTNLIKNLMNW